MSFLYIAGKTARTVCLSRTGSSEDGRSFYWDDNRIPCLAATAVRQGTYKSWMRFTLHRARPGHSPPPLSRLLNIYCHFVLFNTMSCCPICICQSDTKILRSTVVERRSFAGELSLSCAWPAADGWPCTYVDKPSAAGEQTRPTQPFVLSGSINE